MSRKDISMPTLSKKTYSGSMTNREESAYCKKLQDEALADMEKQLAAHRARFPDSDRVVSRKKSLQEQMNELFNT